jgi:ABC-type dipeptide/oligopeptide/nickel transport system ATPase component
MTFTAKKNDNPIVLINGGLNNGDIIYVDDAFAESNIIENTNVRTVSIKDGKFEIIPNKKLRVIYIVGSSGSGKSTICARYIKKFKKLNPKNEVFIFSQLAEDPAFDKLYVNRVVLDQSLIDNPINIESDINKGDLIIFDDCSDNPKPLQMAIDDLETRLLCHGRKLSIGVIITSHLMTKTANSVHSRNRINEMQMLVIFPQSGSSAQLLYGLKTQFGFSQRQAVKILETNSRWICLTKTYPNLLIEEKKIQFTKEIK